MFRIVIADDDAGVRAALRALFGDDARFEVVGEAADADECVALVQELDPDVVLLDSRMPGTGLAVAQLLSEMRAATVVLSAQLDARLLAQFIEAGIRGAFDKGTSSVVLPDLVARCAAGERLLHARATPEALRLLSSQ